MTTDERSQAHPVRAGSAGVRFERVKAKQRQPARFDRGLHRAVDDEAERVYALLFAKGFAFLTLRYPEQWAEGEAILGRVTSENLEPTLDRLVGAPFLRELRARQAAYGEALGITKSKAATPEAVNLVEPLRAARAALATYARVVVAAVENGDLDEAVAIPMLAPLASLRASLRGKRKPSEPAEPSPVSPEPLPPVE